MPINHRKTGHRIIKSFEADQLKDRSLIIKTVDWATGVFGSIKFLIFNAILFGTWIAINTGQVKEIPIFDPYPFILLTMAVSLEAIFLSIIVLMSQNKQSQISTLREELDMQVNLIAEREITMSLKVLKKIAEKLGVEINDHEFKEMTDETDVSFIQTEIQEQIDKMNKPPELQKLAENFNPLTKKSILDPTSGESLPKNK
jgi:uncharacterized membrane protein